MLGKAVPVQAYYRPLGIQKVNAHRFRDSVHMKVAMSAVSIGRLYPAGDTSVTHFCWRVSRPQGQSAAGEFMSMNISMIPSEVEPANLQLQYLYQLHHCMPPENRRGPPVYVGAVQYAVEV